VSCGLVDFPSIMVGCGDCTLVFPHVWAFLRFGGYCDRRHAHGAVKVPAHMPNLAVLALSSSAL
jgi:hypothetical protein